MIVTQPKQNKKNPSQLPISTLVVIHITSQTMIKYGSLVRDIPINHIVPNRELITLIWYNPFLTESSTDLPKISNLRRFNNYILLYTQKSLCIEWLTSNQKTHDRIIIVLYGIELLDKAYACEQVHTIVIVDSNNQSKLDETYHNKRCGSKAVLVFEESDLMLEKVEEVISKVEDQMVHQIDGVFSTFSQTKEIALRDLQHALGSSIWCQVFKGKKNIDSFLNGNDKSDASINDFEKNYRAINAIGWYTKPSFLFRTINRALRTEDIIALYTFRYFITDLSTSLETARTEQLPTCVYRGAFISRDEVEKYQVGYIVATNAFFSASCNRTVAEIFCGFDDVNSSTTRSRSDHLQHVLFEIHIDHNHLSDIILADISHLSACPYESEILFDTGTAFEIISINYDDQHHVWIIQLQSSTKVLPTYRNYGEYIETLMKETSVDILFGILLTAMGEYTKTLDYFERLLTRMSDDHKDRANVYYSMSRAHRFQGEYETALELLHKAERLQYAKSSESNFDFARILAGIGSVYYELHKYEQELLYYQRAMEIYDRILPNQHIEIARSLNRLGYAFMNQQCYTQALSYLTKALDIYEAIAPDSHPGIAQTVLNLGIVYHAEKHMEQALEFYERARKLIEEILPKDHLHRVLLYYQLSLFYEEQQQLDLALKYAKEASDIAEKRMSSEQEMRHKVQDTIIRLSNKPIQ